MSAWLAISKSRKYSYIQNIDLEIQMQTIIQNNKEEYKIYNIR